MVEKNSYVFGPVPSRRLGRSLGVDVVPLKACTQNCVYCQLGVDCEPTLERKVYYPASSILDELEAVIRTDVEADYITISGSGEPTLNRELGELIDGIKKVTDIPVAIITNGTMLVDKEVRGECVKADVVLPSLDAGDEETYQKINRPHPDINFGRFVEGLCRFREEFGGQIWLEVFLIDPINTSDEQLGKINSLVGKIKPDKVQINTAVRPVVDQSVKRMDIYALKDMAEKFDGDVEVIADYSKDIILTTAAVNAENVLSMLDRRPCTLKDICQGMGMKRSEAVKYLTLLETDGKITSAKREGELFFQAK